MTGDLFDLLDQAPPPPPRQAPPPATAAANGARQVSCGTLDGARAWLTQNGWGPRHGGGYDKGGRGFAIIKSPSPPACIVIIERT